MTAPQPLKFKAILDIIGINPFVFVPENVLQSVFKQAGKDRSPIRIKGTVNKLPYRQSLVKYAGHWRLYINLAMLENSPKRIGEKIIITIEYDPEAKEQLLSRELMSALNKNKQAKTVFETLRPSLQREINGYIARLKTKESIEKNVKRAIGYLLGENTFVGNYKINKPLAEQSTSDLQSVKLSKRNENR